MNALGCPSSESRAQAKKPFDWMNEEQFRNLQVIFSETGVLICCVVHFTMEIIICMSLNALKIA